MSNGKAICTVVYNRPLYFRRVLESLSRCVGIQQYVLVACVEPGNDETQTLVEAIDFMECRTIFNPRWLGFNANIYQAFGAAFELADFVILMEDDVLLAKDALAYYEFCRERYRDDQGVLSVTGHNRSTNCPSQSYHEVLRRRWFVPWGCAFWKDRWQMLAAGWHRHQRTSWDVRINNRFTQRLQLFEIYPRLSRVQNIGAEGGANVPSAEWHHQHQHVPFWAEDAGVAAGEFWEEGT
jgi:hypothetical protein